MPGRVEPLAHRVVGLDAGALQRLLELAANEGHAPRELGIVISRAKSPLEVVQRRDQLTRERGLAAPLRLLRIARRALAVVLEVGLGPLGQLQVLVALPRYVGDEGIEIGVDSRCGVVFGFG
jgi:hypothetical protein